MDEHMVCEVRDCPGFGTSHPPQAPEIPLALSFEETVELSRSKPWKFTLSNVRCGWRDSKGRSCGLCATMVVAQVPNPLNGELYPLWILEHEDSSYDEDPGDWHDFYPEVS